MWPNKRSSILSFTHTHNNSKGWFNQVLCRMDKGKAKQHPYVLPVVGVTRTTVPPFYRPHVHIEFKYCPSIHLHYIQVLFHIYLIIVTIGAHHQRKDTKKVFIKNCLHHLGSQMPLSPRITKFEKKKKTLQS